MLWQGWTVVAVAAVLLPMVSSLAGGSGPRHLPSQPSCQVDRTEIVRPRISRPRKLGLVPPPTLRVLLTWRGRQRVMTLFQSDVSVGKMMTTYEEDYDGGNSTVVVDTQAERCYYQGFLKRDSASYAALSACYGLAGYVQTDRELLFIQPAFSYPAQKGRLRQWVNHPHVIYTCHQSPLSSANSTDSGAPPEIPRADPRPRRRRRSAGRKRYLEVLLVVDHTVVNMHGPQRVKDYALTLMNIANSVYQHHSLGVNLRVVVTEILLLKESDYKQVIVKRDAYRTVQRFCQWMTYRQPHVRESRHDISVLLTREKMGPAGYAPITGLCNPSRSCAAITDEGFTSGFIIAHEMAHVFGLFHDGQWNSCTGPRYATAIMAPLVEAKLNRFWWSECSKQRMQQVIHSLYCLNDEPDLASDVDHYDLDSGAELAADMGRLWSLDFQCRLEFGDEFGLCASFPSDQCHMLWCSQRSNPHLCRTKRGPPAPGSKCGQDRECRNYRCTYVGREQAVHGSWSDWSQWEPCSADCGVGITRRSRHCSKPRPAYGGKECEGESSSWDTCVGEVCEAYYDFREAQCSVWNEMNIRRGQHDWLPYPARRESQNCQQTCISSQTEEVVTIDVEVSDGTPCDYDHPSNICFLGKCLKVSCDGVQNSTKDYDSCGVCGGDNSQCKNVSGLFERVPAGGEEYEAVVFLPKGARNIRIEKKGRAKHFLALKRDDYGTYPLNGNKRQERSRVFILAGARVEYSNRGGLQTISTKGPLHTNVEVMLYPDKDMREASVTYNYSIHKSDVTLEKRKYQWRFKEWSECSVTCDEGVTAIIHACHDKDTGEQVADAKCQYLDPPRKDEAPCSRQPCSQTRYMWAMTNDWTECNAERCGEEGEQTQGYECQLYFMNNDTYEIVALDLCDSDTTPHESRNCTAPPCQRLNWTIGEWSECSVTCGKGRQSRRVYCGDPDTDSDDILCQDMPPPLSRPCQEKRCRGKDAECRDHYSFCAMAHGLSLKCTSERFQQICCRSCKRHQNAARSPSQSRLARLMQRRLRRRRRRLREN